MRHVGETAFELSRGPFLDEVNGDVTYALEADSTSSSEEGKESSSINPLCFVDSDVIISSGSNAHLG